MRVGVRKGEWDWGDRGGKIEWGEGVSKRKREIVGGGLKREREGG